MEVEITAKTINPKKVDSSDNKVRLLQMIKDSHTEAPAISPEINIRHLIDESQYSAK